MNKSWFRKLLFRRFFIILLLTLQLVLIIYSLASSGITSTFMKCLFTIISVLTCVYIISQKDKDAFKLIWVFVILLFPLFGGLFYLIFNFQISTKRFLKKTQQIEVKSKELAMLPGTAYEQLYQEKAVCLPQVTYLQKHVGFPVYADSDVQYLSPGEKKLTCLLAELEKAEKYIFLEYFIICEGVMWNSILEVLKKKAHQGVKVRVMYDDLGCFVLLPKDYPKMLRKEGIECVVFNPFKPILTTIQNNRDHRKIAVIDGKVAFTGGINLSDEYINAFEKYGHWKDSSVMVKGYAAWSMTLMFLQMWELSTGIEEDYLQYYPWKDESSEIHADGYVQPYADSPMDKENVCEHVYMQVITNAKEYVYINTPYLIVDDSMVSALCLSAKSGVDVRIVTPHKWDKWAIHMTTRSYYRDLISSGVRIYEYSKGFIHSKTFVSDDTTATVGTANMDFRSLYLHFECGVWMYKTKAVKDVKDDFLQTLELCQEITVQDCKRNVLMRVFQDFMRLIAPLL